MATLGLAALPSACARSHQDTRASTATLELYPYVYQVDNDAERIPAEFGYLTVPEVRGDPEGRTIKIAFVRLRSTAAQPGVPIFFLAGGPGGSGIRAGTSRYEADHADYRHIADVVFVDQRGTGLSLPSLLCPVRWRLPFDHAVTREEAISIARDQSTECAQFWRDRGVDMRGYTTEENADDMDDLRAALGYDRIQLVGGSYGSHLALSTIRRHGVHVERAIIALVEGPNHTLKMPANIQRQLEKLDSMVAEEPAIRSYVPDLLGLIRSVLTKLEKQPETVRIVHPVTHDSVDITVGRFDLAWITAGPLGSETFLSELPARYYQMSQGDFRWLAETAARYHTDWEWRAMTHYMDCASGANAQRRQQIEEQMATTLLGDLADFPTPHQCTAWGSPDLGDEFRSPIESEVPVLFMDGTLDGRTPLTNSEEVMRGFPNSQLLVVENMGHNFGHDYLHEDQELKKKIESQWLAFLAGAPPRPDTIPHGFRFVLPTELDR